MSNCPTDLHVAIYLRKSRADMEAEARGEGETLAKHRKALFALAKHNHYIIDDIYEELVSGERIIDRPEVQRMLQSVQDKKYEAVLCMDVDRLGRGNMVDQGLIQEAFKTSGTLIITPRKVYDLDDEMDEEYSEFESFMARRELKIITRRMQQGRRMSAQEGRSITGKPPYGYMRDKNYKLYPHPEEATIVRQIFEWQASGNGIIKISKLLNDMNVPSPLGKLWVRTSVRNVLNNEAYLGKIVWRKRKHTKGAAGKYHIEKLDESEWIVSENAHEAIVSQELWNAAREMRGRMTPRVKEDYTLKNPFAGIMRCASCGRVMAMQTRSNRPNGVNQATLVCRGYNCNTRQTLIRKLEKRVLENLREIIRKAPISGVQKKREQDRSITLLERKLETLQKELKQIRQQKDNVFDFYEQKIYDTETFMERTRTISDRFDETNNEILHTQKQIENVMSAQSENNIFPAIKRVLSEYEEAATFQAKNELLKSIFEKIEYTRSRDWEPKRECELQYYFKV